MAALALTGCEQHQAPPKAHTPASTDKTTAHNPPGIHVKTARYAININLPKLPADEAALGKVVQATAANAKREFLANLPDVKEFPESAGRQFDLKLTFKVVATTPRFTSIRESGMADTGGAHPIPVEDSFNYDRQRQTLIGLTDLFSDPDTALRALADYSRKALDKQLMAFAPGPDEGSPDAIDEWHNNTTEMLHAGTRPDPKDFSVFTIRAGDPSPGLTLIFPPYQVAAYVYGTLTVNIPTDIFVQQLKPEYRDAFTRG